MYQDRFGLRGKPFGNTPDPAFFYFSTDHRRALVTLSRGIQNRSGLMLLLGEVGTGKTTICCHVHDHAGYLSGYLNYPFLTELEFLQTVNKELGVPVGDGSRKSIMEELDRYLIKQHHEGKPVVLIVDEAHRLALPILDEILILSNLQLFNAHLLQIILAAQPPLLDTLQDPRLRSLNQRIDVRCNLPVMDRLSTIDYIGHRLAKAGCINPSLFSSGALDTIWKRSKGTPRLINQLGERALNEAYRKGKKGVGRREVTQVANDPLYQPLFGSKTKQWSTRAASAGALLALGVGVLFGLSHFGVGSKYLPGKIWEFSQVTAKHRTLIKKPINVPQLANKVEKEPENEGIVTQEGAVPVVAFDEAALASPDSQHIEITSLVEPQATVDLLPDLKLNAIAWDENSASSIAVLNDRIVHEGDFLKDVRVLRIKPNHVVLLQGDEHIIKRIHTPEEVQIAAERGMSGKAEKEETALSEANNDNRTEQAGSVLDFRPIINFSYRTSSMAPEAYIELERFAAIAKLSPEHEIIIRGYTDNVGSYRYNERLSRSRARIVQNYLVDQGINPERIRVIGMGEADPLMPNTSPEGRTVNRRVEVELVPVGDS